MAILNSIRKRGIFLIIIIAMALFAFVLTDVINKGGGGGPANQNVIATVNGSEINKVEFNSLVDLAQRNRYRGATSRASGWLASAIFSPTLKITGTNLSPRSVLTIVFLAFLEDSLYIIFLSFNVGFRL